MSDSCHFKAFQLFYSMSLIERPAGALEAPATPDETGRMGNSGQGKRP